MHDAYPMNQSSYTPVIANISYEREEEKETDQGMDATSVDNSELFHKHEKLDPDFFDFKLYKIRSKIYALTALKVMKGENVCDLLSLLAHMLCFAADDCTFL